MCDPCFYATRNVHQMNYVNPEDGSDKLTRNTDIHLPDYAASLTRSQYQEIYKILYEIVLSFVDVSNFKCNFELPKYSVFFIFILVEDGSSRFSRNVGKFVPDNRMFKFRYISHRH